MSHRIPCLTSKAAGTDAPLLRGLLADATQQTGRDLADELLTLYDHNGFLLATWRDEEAREKWSGLITRLWAERTDGAPYLHFVCSEEDYNYDEDDLDHGADL